MDVLAVAGCLLAYNNLLNRWSRFHGPWYVVFNGCLTVALVWVAIALLDLGFPSLGLSGWSGSDLMVGAALGAAIVAPLAIASRFRRAAAAIADRRVEGLQGRGLAFQLLLRIPLGTALLEEVAFRGVLFGGWRSLGTVQAAWLSSVAFGLWHVGPTVNLVEMNRPSARKRVYLVAVSTAVAFTTVAGIALVWLRIRFGTIAAPFAAHSMINIGGTVAALLAHRRLQASEPPECVAASGRPTGSSDRVRVAE